MKITDCAESFNWDTSEYSTDEQDITGFLAPCLNTITRRAYSIQLDLTAVGEDSAFDRLYVAVKEKVDGVNFRAFKRLTVLKDEIAVTAEPVIILTVPPTSRSIQITLEMKTALMADALIYFCVARTHLE